MMSGEFDFNLILHPYGDSPELGTVGIDTKQNYGYWEHRDGSEGGGLWFYNETGVRVLIDYDGAWDLPKAVVKALREQKGFSVGDVFD